jgi:hypothetical protein
MLGGRMSALRSTVAGMDEIEEVLRKFAADEPGRASWEIYRNTFVTRVEAQTLADYSSRGEAFAGADALAKALLDLGYREKGLTEVGAIADQNDPSSLPERWRGRITLIMEPVFDDRL